MPYVSVLNPPATAILLSVRTIQQLDGGLHPFQVRSPGLLLVGAPAACALGLFKKGAGWSSDLRLFMP